MASLPNILLILCDDMGFSDIGCYGGEINTPNLDRLAEKGIRFTQFYNTARCCPSRASLLTGLHPHQTGIGHMMGDMGYAGYRGDLNFNCVTIAEALKSNGYVTYMSGKWHVTRFVDGPIHNWPCQRGFDRFYGIITGASNYFNPSTLTRDNKRIEAPEGEYYITDAISDEMSAFLDEHGKAQESSPFFAYLSYTAPHWPLHALPEDIERYEGRFDQGWNRLREQRRERMVQMGILDQRWKLSELDPAIPDWDDEEHVAWQARRMEVYAAQIDRMDQGIGRVLQTLRDSGQLDNTLTIFLSDNGACAEELRERDRQWCLGRIAWARTRDGREVSFGNNPDTMPGSEETYQSCGLPWANVSNTPFREYKHWVHEGGIATPFIVSWHEGFEARGEFCNQPGYLPDVMATCLDVADISYPTEYNGCPILPLEGCSLRSFLGNGSSRNDRLLCLEHEGNRAIRRREWKLVSKYPGQWEMYNMIMDRTEQNNLVDVHPDTAIELATLYRSWSCRCNVLPWNMIRRH